jgi:glycosyltransferase involved in cell wall biosynthesis
VKVLVIDSWFKPFSATTIPGGAEKAALQCAKSLGGTLYTSKTLDDCTEIDGVPLVWSHVPPRIGWPVDDASMSRGWAKIREQEIETLVLRDDYDVVINNSSSASHVAALTRLRAKTGVATVNFCHLSFAVYSFSRFGLVTQLAKHAEAGGINVTTCADVIGQVDRMLAKKESLIGFGPGTEIFHGHMPPSTLDHVPQHRMDHEDGVFAMCRFAEDKNVKDLVPMLISIRKMGIPVLAHFSSGADLEGLAKAATLLRQNAVEVEIDVPQNESFAAASTALLHLTASHTECYGIVPCEMAALGVPTAYVEKGEPHVLRGILGDFGLPIDLKKNKDWASDVYGWAACIDLRARRETAQEMREKHSAEFLASEHARFAQMAIDRTVSSARSQPLDFV